MSMAIRTEWSRLLTDGRRRRSPEDRSPTALRSDGALSLAGSRLARTSALDHSCGHTVEHDRFGRGRSNRLRARPVGLLAQLAGAIACVRAKSPRDRDGPAGLRSLADAQGAASRSPPTRASWTVFWTRSGSARRRSWAIRWAASSRLSLRLRFPNESSVWYSSPRRASAPISIATSNVSSPISAAWLRCSLLIQAGRPLARTGWRADRGCAT